MLLVEYDIVYMIRKVVKGSVIADHLADNVMEDYEPLNLDLSNKHVLVIEDDGEMNGQWTMYFNGVLNVLKNGARVVIISIETK